MVHRRTAVKRGPGLAVRVRPWWPAASLLVAALAGCSGGAGGPSGQALPFEADADARAFTDLQGREFDLVADRDDPAHLMLAFITPRADPASPSWLAVGQSRDAGATWSVRRLCGDPLDAGALAADPACPFAGARLTSDPVLMQLADGSFLYVGVALRPQEVTQFAARFPRGALEPESVHVVSRSAFAPAPGAHQVLPAPHMAYYNGKANVMQAGDGRIHLVWAADFGPENDAGPQVTTGIPFWTTSADGGRTWSDPVRLAPQSFEDVGDLYAVGVQAFQTRDGRLHAVWWDSYTNALYQVSSGDGGRTFSAPRWIADVVARPPDARADSDNLTRLWVGVDRSGGARDGTVYLLADDKSGGDRDLVLFASRDDGESWQRAAAAGLPRGNGRDETMARLLVEPSGALSVLSPSWQPLERWTPSEMLFARSTDGGAGFDVVTLSSAPNPHPNPGDYNGLAATEGGVLAVWEDARGEPAGGRWAWQALVRVP